MANLNIKVKVDVSEADKLDKIASSLKKKLEAVEIDIGKGAIESLQKSIAKIDSKESIDIKVNTDQAVKQLNNLESEFTSLKAKLEDSFNLNFKLEDTFGKFSADDIVKDFKKSFSGIDDSLFENFRKAQEGYKQSAINAFKDMDVDFKVSDTLKKQQSEINKMTKEIDRETKGRIDDFKTQVNQYKRLAQDLAQMQTKYDSGDLTGNQMKNLEQQITRVKSVMEDLRSSMKVEASDMGLDFKDFGGSADEYFNSIVQGSAKAQQEMKEFAKSITESKEAIKEITKLENERSKAVRDSQNKTVGENEAKYLQDRAQALEKEISIRKELEAFQNASANDRNQFAQLENSNRALEEQIQLRKQAQQADEQAKARIKEQAEAYSALNKEIKSMNKAQEEVAKLQTRQDEGIATTANLEKLEKQKVLLDNYKKSVEDMQNSIKTSGLQNDTFDKQAQSLKEAGQAAAELESRMEQAGAAVRKQEANYKDIEASMKRQHQYAKQMISAEESGNRNTAQEYARLMQYEEQYQAQIRQRGNISEQANRQMFGDQADEYRRLEDSHRRMVQARDSDSRRSGIGDYKSMFGMDSVVATIDIMDVFREVSNQIRQSFDSFLELDSALVDVRKVVEATDSEFQGFTDTIFDNASAVGKTASEYTVSVERWASAGKSLAEAQELARLSTMGAFVGNIDEAAMVDYMSVPLNAFSSAGLEAQDILNAMNEVANKNAIEMNDLGIAYQRASATAAASGTSFAELTGLITAAQEATRLGGQTIGTAFRSMDVNFGKMFTGATKQDDKRTEFFESLGVSIKDSNGGLRSTYDILQDLSGAWGGLTDQQKQQATYYAAGKQYSNILASLMNNWSKVEEVAGQAQEQLGLPEGVGSAFDEFASQSDSMAFKLAKLKNTWMEFQQTLLGGDASGVFKGALEGLTNFIEKMNELVQNKDFMNAMAPIAKGIMGILGTDLALTIGKKIFGDGGISNFIKDMRSGGMAVDSLGKAVKGVGKGGFFKNLLTAGGLQALPMKVMLAITAFELLDNVIESITGKDIGSHLKSALDPLDNLDTKLDKYSQSVQNMNDTFEKNRAIQSQIDDYREFARTVEEANRVRNQAFVQSGKVADLEIDETDFQSIMDKHNEMVEQFNLPVGFRIEFNNYEHIMEQIARVRAELAEIEAETMRDNIGATNQAFSDRRDVLSQIEKETSALKGHERQLESNRVAAEKLENAGYDRIYDGATRITEKMANELGLSSDTVGKTVGQIYGSLTELQGKIDDTREGLANVLDPAKWEENEKAVKKATEEMGNYIDKILDGDDPSSLFMDLFGSDTIEAQQAGIFSFLLGTNERIRATKLEMDNFNEAKKEFGNWSDLEGLDKSLREDSFEALNNSITEVVKNSKEFQDVLSSTDYSSIGELFDAAVEGVPEAQEAINKIVNEVIPNALESQIKTLEEAKSDLLTVAGEAGFTSDQIAELTKATEAGASMGDTVRKMIQLNAGAATAVLGIDPYSYSEALMRFGDNVSEVFGDITDSVYNLQNIDPVRFDSLVDDSGIPEFDKIISDLSQITNEEFLFEIGVIGADGAIEDIGAFYDVIDALKSADVSELGKLNVEGFDLTSGNLPNFQGILDAINAGELTVKPSRINVETGRIESFELSDGDGNIATVDVQAEADTTAMGEQIAKDLEGSDYEIKVTTALNAEGEAGSGGYDNWIRSIASQYEGERDIEVPLNLRADISPTEAEGEISKLLEGLTGDQVEQLIEVVPKFETAVGEDGSVDFNILTDLIGEVFNSGDTEQIEKMVDVLVTLGLLEDNSKEQIDEALQSEDGEYTVEDEVDAELELGEVNASGVSGGIEKVVTAGLGPYNTEAIVEVALKENIVQDNMSGISDILSRDYGVNIDVNVEDGGLEQVTSALSDLPPSQQIMVIAEAMGLDNLSAIEAILEGVPENKVIETIMQVTGQDTLAGAVSALSQITDKEATATMNVVKSGEVEPIEDTETEHLINIVVSNPESIMALDGKDISFTVTANMTDHVSSKIANINSELSSLPSSKTIEISVSSDGANSIQSIIDSMSEMQTAQTATITVTADASSAQSAINQVNMNLMSLSMKVVTVKIDGDNSGYMSAAGEVINHVIPSKQVTITAYTAPFYNAVNNLSVSKSVSVTVNAKINRSKSVAIGRDLSTAFSQSIGSDLGLVGRSASVGVNRNYSSTDNEKTVNEDVWRYWAKELYTGTPLENTMDELNSQLKRVDGNFQEMIRIYRQQIQVTREQIQFEKDMAKLRQNEMNSILQELRALGFKTDGNRITNLDFAQGLSGDTATDADKLLTDWKSLYESITGLNSSISRLESQMFEIEKDIEQARMDEELERLEKRLSKTDLLISALNNHLDILNTKDSLISDLDYELKIAVSEENIDTSVSNIQRLIREFNELSTTSVEFSENAEVVYDRLEELSDEIVANADNIVEFREQINQVRIDALVDDFDRFTEAVNRNADSISNNVSILREGLVSGSGLSELGQIFDVNFNRRSALDKVYADRLRLEANLDNALEQYAKSQIQRTITTSRAQLQIAEGTYRALASIYQGQSYSGGYFMDAEKSFGIGLTNAKLAISEFDRYQVKMLDFMDEYQAQYQNIASIYELSMKSAITYSDKQQAQMEMILSQLALQEEFQTKAIAQYQEAIRLAQEQLKNESLTTDQRRELLELIDEYKGNISDAQKVIREAIAERYDYEFEMMDKLADKGQKYYDSINHLIDVGNLVNLSPDAMYPFYEALYGASIYQYQLAKEQLAELNKEQRRFEEGSYEWNLLGEKIEEINESVKELGINALEANRSILENTLNALETQFEKGFLNDKTLDQWKDYYDNWLDGIDKELKLEELRLKALGLESNLINSRLEALDRQEAVSQKDVEYMDKQLKVLELQNKLRNIDGERNVQVLTRREDGSWGFEYQADQSEYEDTQKDLNEAERELAEYRRQQRGAYVSDLGDIIERARNGEYASSDALQADLTRLNSVYGYVLDDLPGFEFMNLDQITEAYQKYLEDNNLIATDLTGGMSPDNTAIQQQSAVFAQSFLNISTDLGNIIGQELRRTLGMVEGQSFIKPNHIYQIGTLSLPNVTDGDGLVRIFEELPKVTEQEVYSK